MGSVTARCDRKSAGRPLRLVQEEVGVFYKSIKPFWQRCKTVGNKICVVKLVQSISLFGEKMKLSFGTKSKLSWQQWNQVCFPMELSPCLLPDLWPLLTWEIFTFLLNFEEVTRHWGFPGGCAVNESGSLGRPGRAPGASTEVPTCFGWAATSKHVLDGIWTCGFGWRIPWPGTTGCSLDRVCFYSTLFPLEAPSAPRPLQPRCCNWDLGACSCPPQQTSHKKAAYSSNLRANKSSITLLSPALRAAIHRQWKFCQTSCLNIGAVLICVVGGPHEDLLSLHGRYCLERRPGWQLCH